MCRISTAFRTESALCEPPGQHSKPTWRRGALLLNRVGATPTFPDQTAARGSRWQGGASRCSGVVLTLAALVGAVRQSEGETIFLGPTPYLSADDSPFNLSGRGETFFLEDFEDGELNTPGISQPGHPLTHAFVRQPGSMTDSVDADDGSVDGFGIDGHSLVSYLTTFDFTTMPTNETIFLFQLDTLPMGGSPHAFGFVWTGGGADSRITLSLLDSDLEIIAEHEFAAIGSELNDATTSGDRFLGVLSDQVFPFVEIKSVYQNRGELRHVEIDHLQYGRIIPEPTTAGLAVVILLVCMFRRTRARAAAQFGIRTVSLKEQRHATVDPTVNKANR